ncbi:MAG: lytic transglycosylase domain-containing protein, partial [Pseudomonadota bacterium]
PFVSVHQNSGVGWSAQQKLAGYLFARIEHARRTENWKLATELLLGAPTNPAVLVNGDEWWVERRIVSRKLVEQGQYKTAYRIAANHSAQSASDIIEAEFHAGWYALRYLNDRGTAQRHFAKMLGHSTRPISIARSHYWMGRAKTGNAAAAHYRQAGVHQGTFYGQLALHELGQKRLVIAKPDVSSTDRNNFENRELVRVIRRLEETGNGGWTNGFYLHLARTLNSPGELAILSANAERQGNFQLALQVGKIANGRGLAVDTLAWPIGAIPGSAKIRADDMALAYAISRQESAFNKAAVSPANARGLMQLLPGTAKAVARKRGYSYSHARLTQDAAYNATLGTAYLNDQMAEFGNSYVLTFIAYNAGPRRVGQWIERFGDPRGKPLYDVIDWVEMIPYSETRHYVQRVLENYQVYKARIAGSRLTLAQDLTRGR